MAEFLVDVILPSAATSVVTALLLGLLRRGRSPWQ